MQITETVAKAFNINVSGTALAAGRGCLPFFILMACAIPGKYTEQLETYRNRIHWPLIQLFVGQLEISFVHSAGFHFKKVGV